MVRRTEVYFPSKNIWILGIEKGCKVLNVDLSGRNKTKIDKVKKDDMKVIDQQIIKFLLPHDSVYDMKRYEEKIYWYSVTSMKTKSIRSDISFLIEKLDWNFKTNCKSLPSWDLHHRKQSRKSWRTKEEIEYLVGMFVRLLIEDDDHDNLIINNE